MFKKILASIFKYFNANSSLGSDCNIFQLNVEEFGLIRTIDLKRNAQNIPVTEENRQGDNVNNISSYQHWCRCRICRFVR